MTSTNEPTVLERAKSDDKENSRYSQKQVVTGVGIGILVGSGILTLVYFTMLGLGLEKSYSIPAALAAGLGLAFGIVAIIPGELSIWLWTTKFTTEENITTGQQVVAGIGAVVAGLVAVATSVSTIAFFFPKIMPKWYLALAENVNFWAIAIGWASVILGGIFFAILGMASRQNKARANALNKVACAENDTITAYAQGLKEASDNVIDQMARDGVFHSDALALVARAMAMNAQRVGLAKRSAIAAGGDNEDLDALFKPVVIENDSRPTPPQEGE
jgi:hypothetical protein